MLSYWTRQLNLVCRLKLFRNKMFSVKAQILKYLYGGASSVEIHWSIFALFHEFLKNTLKWVDSKNTFSVIFAQNKYSISCWWWKQPQNQPATFKREINRSLDLFFFFFKIVFLITILRVRNWKFLNLCLSVYI